MKYTKLSRRRILGTKKKFNPYFSSNLVKSKARFSMPGWKESKVPKELH
jgi:hypothetical protein